MHSDSPAKRGPPRAFGTDARLRFVIYNTVPKFLVRTLRTKRHDALNLYQALSRIYRATDSGLKEEQLTTLFDSPPDIGRIVNPRYFSQWLIDFEDDAVSILRDGGDNFENKNNLIVFSLLISLRGCVGFACEYLRRFLYGQDIDHEKLFHEVRVYIETQ